MKLSSEYKINLLLGLFVTALVAANLLGNKITLLLGISVSVGIFSYPLTFLIINIILETKGKETAESFIYTGFISLIAVLILTAVSLVLPPASRFIYNKEYSIIFRMSLRIIIGSLTAFLVAQAYNMWFFGKISKILKNKFGWLRYNASVILSLLIDTIIFYFVAFYQMTPKFTAWFILQLVLPYWFMKILFSLISTPFWYGGVRWIKKKTKPLEPPIAVAVPVGRARKR